ncbi:hypothetical protein [Sporosarcina sp. FSL K6-2383]|uniref:hypothetical protein n=1 Tax=Sporosarcina sp. FSL K6-2383 TaxID=2921556 RepID=UPI00315A6884
MTTFIEKHYERITWFFLIIGFILLFTASDYVSLVLFFYLLVRAIKFRTTIRKTLQNTPRSTMFIYALGMIVLIAALVVVMWFSSSFVQKHTIPGFLQYIYVAIVLVGSMFFYTWFMDFLVKVWNKKKSSK